MYYFWSIVLRLFLKTIIVLFLTNIYCIIIEVKEVFFFLKAIIVLFLTNIYCIIIEVKKLLLFLKAIIVLFLKCSFKIIFEYYFCTIFDKNLLYLKKKKNSTLISLMHFDVNIPYAFRPYSLRRYPKKWRDINVEKWSKNSTLISWVIFYCVFKKFKKNTIYICQK